MGGAAQGVISAPWMSAVIVDGRASKELCSVLAAAVVSLTTTHSQPDPIAPPVPLNSLDLTSL